NPITFDVVAQSHVARLFDDDAEARGQLEHIKTWPIMRISRVVAFDASVPLSVRCVVVSARRKCPTIIRQMIVADDIVASETQSPMRNRVIRVSGAQVPLAQ